MDAQEHYFVEWQEQYASKERGNRVVHYFLKDNLGESIRAVVGTERSVRHMFYVVSEEFLCAHGAKTSVHAGFRWRSRREVVNWLTSMLSKQLKEGDCASTFSLFFGCFSTCIVLVFLVLLVFSYGDLLVIRPLFIVSIAFEFT